MPYQSLELKLGRVVADQNVLPLAISQHMKGMIRYGRSCRWCEPNPQYTLHFNDLWKKNKFKGTCDMHLFKWCGSDMQKMIQLIKETSNFSNLWSKWHTLQKVTTQLDFFSHVICMKQESPASYIRMYCIVYRDIQGYTGSQGTCVMSTDRISCLKDLSVDWSVHTVQLAAAESSCAPH